MQHFQRPLTIERLESRQLLAGDAFGFQNPLVHQDVNNDEVVTPMDVLLIANRLNGNDGDENITPTDGLNVINGLNGTPRETLPVFEHARNIARKLRKTHPSLPADLQTIGTQVLDRMDEFEIDIQAIRRQIRDLLDLPDTDRANLKTRIQNIRNVVTQHATTTIGKLDLLKADDIDTAQLETGELDNRSIPIPQRLREAMEVDDLPSDLDAERVAEVMDAMDKRQWRPFRHQGFKHHRPRLTPQTREQHLERLQAKINSGTLPEFINTEKASRFVALLQGAEGEPPPLTEDFSPQAHDDVFAELATLPVDDNLNPTFPG